MNNHQAPKRWEGNINNVGQCLEILFLPECQHQYNQIRMRDEISGSTYGYIFTGLPYLQVTEAIRNNPSDVE
jgi:hypothetical protein